VKWACTLCLVGPFVGSGPGFETRWGYMHLTSFGVMRRARTVRTIWHGWAQCKQKPGPLVCMNGGAVQEGEGGRAQVECGGVTDGEGGGAQVMAR
jgi:hypothetical protein